MASRFTELENNMSIPKEFINNKQLTLNQTDRSKKGSIDAPIISLIDRINVSPYFYTTSSCSGRMIVYSEKREGGKHCCRWIFTSHTTCMPGQAQKEIRNGVSGEDEVITLKFEPLILHICCANVECAKTLMKAAVGCGYRNSGLSLGKRILLAVRSTQGMEVPIGRDGSIIMGEECLTFLIEQANVKMQLNTERIKMLEQTVGDVMEKLLCEEGDGKKKNSRIIEKGEVKSGEEGNNAEGSKIEDFSNEENILESLFQI